MFQRTQKMMRTDDPIVLNESDAGVLRASGLIVPSDGEPGYATGCLFQNLGASSNSDVLYANIGSNTSCNFNAVTVASD